jgi:nicotinate phosphoribosyltransferase
LSLDDEDPRQLDPIGARHPADYSKYRGLAQSEISSIEPLLVEVLHQGTQVYDPPPLAELRARRIADMERLDAGVRRLINPHIYHVSLTERLWELKQRVIAKAHQQSR